MASTASQERVRILAVIVLYKLKLKESVTLSSLQASIADLPEGHAEIRILVYDNTPGGQDPGEIPAGVRYTADPENKGLAPAYNYAIQVAREDECDWLLTLDQDTCLPRNFVQDMVHAARYIAHFDRIAAITPLIREKERIVSPYLIRRHLALLKPFPDGFVGVALENTTAANSGSMIKVSALMEIGGYDPRFHFDLSDWVLFHRLYQNNYVVFVAGNIRVEHSLSVLDLGNRTTPERYAALLRAEDAFCNEYMGRLESTIIFCKILYRLAYKIWATGGSLAFFKVSLRFLCGRIFRSRATRMKIWEEAARRRSTPGQDCGAHPGNHLSS